MGSGARREYGKRNAFLERAHKHPDAEGACHPGERKMAHSSPLLKPIQIAARRQEAVTSYVSDIDKVIDAVADADLNSGQSTSL